MNDDKFYDKIKGISTAGLTKQLENQEMLTKTQEALIGHLEEIIKIKNIYIEKLNELLEVK